MNRVFPSISSTCSFSRDIIHHSGIDLHSGMCRELHAKPNNQIITVKPMAQTDQFHKNMFIMYNNDPYFVTDCEFYSPGKGSAFTRVKMKNLNTNRVIPFTFKSGERVEELEVSFKTMQFLYADDNNAFFMNPETYEQVELSTALIENYLKYMKGGSDYILIIYNEKPISIKFPPQVVLEITETSPAVKGNTATNATKEATLETGAVVQVPQFLSAGTKVRIDPETGYYQGKATE